MLDITLKLSKGQEEEIVTYYCDQIETALSDRKNMESKWEEFVNLYEEIVTPKTFPWRRASNIFVPLIPTNVETVYSRMVNTILGIQPYITITPQKALFNPNGEDVSWAMAKKMERFLDYISRFECDWYNKCSEWFLETVKMGTGIIKPYWSFEESTWYRNSAFGFQEVNSQKGRVVVDVLNLSDFIVPKDAKHEQTCDFVAQRLRLTWNDILRRSKLKGEQAYRNISKIKDFYKQDQKDDGVEKTIDEKEGTQKKSPEKVPQYQPYEVWGEYEIKGKLVNLVATIESQSRTLLRAIKHPYIHGRRPFIIAKFMKRTNRLYGKGVCEMLKNPQEQINTTIRQRMDAGTISNIKCFKARKSARKDIGDIYPGKVFYLDDPENDLQEMLIGDVKQSAFLEEQSALAHAERRLKVSDYVSGRESSITKSRATATGTMALLQESGRFFDLLILNAREAMKELSYQTIELYRQHDPEKEFKVTENGKDSFMQMEFPEQNIRDSYSFACTATTMSVNREIQKQANIMLMQQLTQIFTQMIQLLQAVNTPMVKQDPQLHQFIMGVIKAYYNFAKRILQSFEVYDMSNLLPELAFLEEGGQGGQGGIQTGGLSPQAVQGISAILDQLAGQAGGGGFGNSQSAYGGGANPVPAGAVPGAGMGTGMA